jgi:hypothetical protein
LQATRRPAIFLPGRILQDLAAIDGAKWGNSHMAISFVAGHRRSQDMPAAPKIEDRRDVRQRRRGE